MPFVGAVAITMASSLVRTLVLSPVPINDGPVEQSGEIDTKGNMVEMAMAASSAPDGHGGKAHTFGMVRQKGHAQNVCVQVSDAVLDTRRAADFYSSVPR